MPNRRRSTSRRERRDPALHGPAQQHIEAATFLADKCDPKAMDANDSRGQRLMNVAVATHSAEMIDLLVKKYHLNIDPADAQGVTPLQLAATREDPRDGANAAE